MKQGQLFYLFDEHTDVDKVLKKIGLQPCGKHNDVFFLGDTKYIRLSPHECYSGCAVTIMALPYMDYTALINVIETAKNGDDIIGSTGLLLKKYPKAFTEYLSRTQTRRSTKIKRIISRFIAANSSYVSEMKPLLEVCKSK